MLAFGANLGTGVDVLELTPQDMREAWASALRRAQSHDPKTQAIFPSFPASLLLSLCCVISFSLCFFSMTSRTCACDAAGNRTANNSHHPCTIMHC